MNFDIDDMRQFADRHRGKNIASGPYWSTIIRFPILFDECERLLMERNRMIDEISNLKMRIENLKMSPDNLVRAQAVHRALEMTGFLRKIMALGLFQGNPRLQEEALHILDDTGTSDIDVSKQDFNNPDYFNNH